MVGFKWGQLSHAKLKSMISSPAPRFVVIEGMGHSSDPEEIAAVSAFLKATLRQ